MSNHKPLEPLDDRDRILWPSRRRPSPPDMIDAVNRAAYLRDMISLAKGSIHSTRCLLHNLENELAALEKKVKELNDVE